MSTKKSGAGMRLITMLLEGVFGSVESIIAGVIASAKKTTSDIIRKVARSVFALFMALLGIIFLLIGGARLLSTALGRPGLGEVVVGLVIFVVALVLYASTREDN